MISIMLVNISQSVDVSARGLTRGEASMHLSFAAASVTHHITYCCLSVESLCVLTYTSPWCRKNDITVLSSLFVSTVFLSFFCSDVGDLEVAFRAPPGQRIFDVFFVGTYRSTVCSNMQL